MDKNGDNPVKRHEKLTELYVEFGVAHVMRRNPDAKEPLTAEEREERKKEKEKKKKERGEKKKEKKTRLHDNANFPNTWSLCPI